MKRILLGIMLLTIMLSFSLSSCGGGTSLEDVRWLLVSYGDPDTPYSVLPDTEVSARFNGGTQQLRGNGGCNSYTGDYEIEGNTFTIIGPFAVTEMWCGNDVGAQESDYLEILLAAESYEIEDDILTIRSGDQVLYYEREKEGQ